ncbi:hypothetical protein J2Z26_000440 [Bacillus luteolus]|nr:hypothetical protein [Cytobacillus luteolus]
MAIAQSSVNGEANVSTEEAIAVAKNELSSAYANSTVAEQKQLRELQDQLNQLQS